MRQLFGQDEVPGEAEPADVQSDEPGPPDLLARAQVGSRLQAALGRLSHQERWLLGLAYYRDHTHVQIAASTALPLGTVKSVLLRAQHKLRTLLEQDVRHGAGPSR